MEIDALSLRDGVVIWRRLEALGSCRGRLGYDDWRIDGKVDPAGTRTPNRLIWSQTRYRCAIAPLTV